MMITTLWLLAALAVAVFVAARFDAFAGKPPTDLGVRDGRFKPPSSAPNSVSSQAALHAGHPMADAARIAPIALRGGDGPATIAAIEKAIASMPGATLVERRADYLRAEVRTRLMRYADDAEFWFDPAGNVVQVRSASRVGRSDFGVNRARIESIRAELTVR